MARKMSFLLVGFVLASFLTVYAPEVLAKDTEAVVYPLGKTTAKPKEVAPSIADLNGKTVCELWNYLFHGDRTFAALEALLKKRYPNVKFVSYKEFGNLHGPEELKLIGELPGKLKKFKCDAVISGNGG